MVQSVLFFSRILSLTWFDFTFIFMQRHISTPLQLYDSYIYFKNPLVTLQMWFLTYKSHGLTRT